MILGMKTILVAVDFSAVTNGVLKAACALAKRVEGSLVLLHVVEPPVVIDVYGLGQEVLAEASAASERISTRRLRQLIQRCQRGGVAARAVQQSGKPEREIVATARRLGAAYIVIGTHGHGAAYDLIVGSTTNGVLRKATCPVLVVPGRAKTRA